MVELDTLKTQPITGPLIERLTSEVIPKADPGRFSILVAHLENDPKGKHQMLIIEALKEYEGIQVLSLDRTIPLRGPIPEEMEESGHTSAIRYLNQSQASVVLCGTVLGDGDHSISKPCHAKRLACWTQWLGDVLLDPVPHRQMVFVLPKLLRPYFKWRRKLVGDLARIAARTATDFVRATLNEPALSVGIVLCIQTHGSLLNWQPHIHAL